MNTTIIRSSLVPLCVCSLLSACAGAGLAQEKELKGHEGHVGHLAFAPNGTLAAVGFVKDMERDDVFHGEIRIWDVSRGRTIRTLPRPWRAPIAYSPDGKLLAEGGGRTITILAAETGKEASQLKLPEFASDVAVAFSPDGKLLAATVPGGVKLWDTSTWKEASDLKAKDTSAEALAFSADGTLLASAGVRVRLWDVAAGKQVATFDTECLQHALAFAPDGKTVIAAGEGGVFVLDIERKDNQTTMKKRKAPHLDAGGGIRSIAISPDGKWLATVGWFFARRDNLRIKVFSLGTLHSHATPPFATSSDLACVAFSTDSKTLAVGGSAKATEGQRAPGVIRLWDVAKLVERKEKPEVAADKKKLYGIWKVVAGDGKAKKDAENAIRHVVFKKTDGESDLVLFKTEKATEDEEPTFRLDGDANPRRITIEGRDFVYRGIYRVEDDTLTLCFADPEKADEKSYPAGFATKAGSKETLIVLKREKP